MKMWHSIRRCFGLHPRVTPLGPVNYIPLSAIRASRKARLDADKDFTDDKYSQEKVSPNVPSDKEVVETPPDAQVLPG